MVQNIPPGRYFCLLELTKVWNYSFCSKVPPLAQTLQRYGRKKGGKGREITMREWGERKVNNKMQRQWKAGSVTPHGSAAQLWQSTFMHIDGTRHGVATDWAVTQWRAAGNSSCLPINQWPAHTPKLLFNCQLVGSPGDAAFSFIQRPKAGRVVVLWCICMCS